MTHRLLILLIGLLTVQATSATGHSKYKNPTGKEFPILAWFSILPDSNLTHERYAELREAGFNISFSHFYQTSEVEKSLKACDGTGVKVMVTCTDLEKNTAECVNRFKNNRNVAGWFLRDEPTTSGFAELKAFRDRVYAADPDHVVYLNLLPSIVPPADLGTQTYEEYVQRFVDEVNLPQISYDFYPVVEDNGKAVLRPQFFDNLENVRRVSLREGIPFWAFCLSTAHDPYPIPTDTHLRIEAFSALAYGAQCIQYFTYWTPLGTIWNFHNAPIDEKGRRTNVYYRVKALNQEIQRLAWVFLGAKATSVGHTGKELPMGTTPLGQLPEKFGRVEADGQGVLVSQLENGKRRFLMVVNRDIDHAQKVSIGLKKGVQRVLPDGTVEKYRQDQTVDIQLKPGDYALFRWK
ncbi:MAG: beta-galactosidase [Prevotella sp.]